MKHYKTDQKVIQRLEKRKIREFKMLLNINNMQKKRN